MSWFRETMLKVESKTDQFENWVKDSVSSATDRTRNAADSTVEQTSEFVDDYQDRTESAMRRIPGYAGYKNKDQARNSDRALRNEIAQQLDQSATKVEAVQRTAANERNVARTTELEPVVQGFRNAANIVRSLSYGYGGLFSDTPVDSAALAQLRLFDEGLMVKVEAMGTAAENLGNGTSEDAAALVQEIANFKAGLEMRGKVITEGRPAKPVKTTTPPAAVDKAFGTSQSAEPVSVELPEVDLGDALSILGDDHLVEAIIDVDTDGATQRFIRLDNKPQMWLWVSSDSSRTPLRLDAVAAPEGVTWDELAGRATISVPDERMRRGPGAIRTASSGAKQYVQLEIDGATQTFAASDVHRDDIETYRIK